MCVCEPFSLSLVGLRYTLLIVQVALWCDSLVTSCRNVFMCQFCTRAERFYPNILPSVYHDYCVGCYFVNTDILMMLLYLPYAKYIFSAVMCMEALLIVIVLWCLPFLFFSRRSCFNRLPSHSIYLVYALLPFRSIAFNRQATLFTLVTVHMHYGLLYFSFVHLYSLRKKKATTVEK